MLYSGGTSLPPYFTVFGSGAGAGVGTGIVPVCLTGAGCSKRVVTSSVIVYTRLELSRFMPFMITLETC
ncbi:MAG: hypothetical protein IKK91_04660 [Ruminococcus sp.]|nr:hypothetical protein [Ruminococcus sp.]